MDGEGEIKKLIRRLLQLSCWEVSRTWILVGVTEVQRKMWMQKYWSQKSTGLFFKACFTRGKGEEKLKNDYPSLSPVTGLTSRHCVGGGGFVAKSCPTLVTPRTVACQAPLSMGILQARIQEWIAISFSRGSSRPRYWTQVSCIAGRLFTN